MPKFCYNCGKELKEEYNVCPNCGAMIKNETQSFNNAANNVNQPNAIPNQSSGTNSFAIAGFVLSIVSLFCCGFTSVLGLIFSIIGLVNSKKYNDNGKGLAIAGVIISAIMFVTFIILGLLGTFTEIIQESAGYGSYY